MWELVETRGFEFALSIASGLFASFLYDLMKARLTNRAQPQPHLPAAPRSRGLAVFYAAMVLNGLVVVAGLAALAYVWSIAASPGFASREELSLAAIVIAFLCGVLAYFLLDRLAHRATAT